MIDFDILTQMDPTNVRAHFFKGKVLIKESQENDAVLHFEQVVKYNTESYLSGNALFEVAKL